VIVTVTVCETTVVTACGPTSSAAPATRAVAKDDACYHNHSDYDHNSQERTH
jgi:hypothetical protein